MKTYEAQLKPLINWKIYNLILDIVLKYEDKGNTCHLAICVNNVPSITTNLIDVHDYKTGEYSYWDEFSDNWSGNKRVIDNATNGYFIFRVLNSESREMIDELKNNPKLQHIGGNYGVYNYFIEKK